jgi:hypothetical protein
MLMRRAARLLLAALMVAVGLQGGLVRAEEQLEITEFTVDPDTLCDIRDEWTEQLLATHKPGTWAKMKFEATDSQLSRMGLPSKAVLSSRRYARPTLVTKDGRFYDVPTRALEQAVAGPAAAAEPTVASVAGAGCLGIRPGALLLLITGNSIGWCSMAHVYGSPGSYDISTAGHCGRPGDTATVIAATGNRGDATGVVLLDFGTFATSHDGGLGNDWALIDIAPAYQGLVSPTMCFWGGPRGMYTNTGQVVGVNFPNNSLIPQVSLTPDPTLAQTVVHYGHGAGVGAGGTPRAGEAIAWGASHFMFFGAISPGDSGSGANTLLGDAVGANMEAAGIMTHLYIDPLMRQGLGIMGGTRATSVAGTLANGQIVPYPAPAPGLP